MEILPGIEAFGTCIRMGRTLIVADLHIGAEEALTKQGYMIPKFQFLEMRDQISKAVENSGCDTVVINGDLKHEFGTISQSEWDNTLKLLDLLAHNCRKVILIRGNHDTLLGPIADKRSVEVKDSLLIGDVLVCHGDKVQFGPVLNQAKTIIIGHEHPAIGFKRSNRVENFKCFLRGKYRSKDLIVMPSFNTLSAGSDVLREKPLSPFLEKGTDDFEVFAVGDKVYPFGKVSILRSL